MDKKCELLEAELRRLPLDELRSFRRHFDECEDRAYTWELWAAAYIIGGGCSGLQYVMDLVDGPKERDILVPTQNVHLVVDPKSALFVSGSVLDYSEDLQKGGFKVTNPNAVAHCSCGESFAV